MSRTVGHFFNSKFFRKTNVIETKVLLSFNMLASEKSDSLRTVLFAEISLQMLAVPENTAFSAYFQVIVSAAPQVIGEKALRVLQPYGNFRILFLLKLRRLH